MFLGQGLLWQQVWNSLSTIQAQSPSGSGMPHADYSTSGSTLMKRTTRLKHTLSVQSTGDFGSPEGDLNPPLKKRCSCIDIEDRTQLKPQSVSVDTKENDLPPDDLIDDLVEIYFASVHPWIPILHVRQFRQKMAITAQRQKLTTIFHAIVSLCVRFSGDARLRNPDLRSRYSKRSRQTVILKSMESFSVENLQALVICTFDTV